MLRVASFSPLVSGKALSRAMASKAATSGLRFRHLLLAHRRDSEHGIDRLLKEMHGDTHRVTASKKILTAVMSFARSMFQRSRHFWDAGEIWILLDVCTTQLLQYNE